MEFVTGLLVLIDSKSKSYDLILVFVDRFLKMVYYKLVKITINTPNLAEVIIDVVVWHYGLFGSIIIDWGSLFMLKFWYLLYYFLEIKRRLPMAFYP